MSNKLPAAWDALVEASLDQPAPTPALRTALDRVLRQINHPDARATRAWKRRSDVDTTDTSTDPGGFHP